MVKRMGNDRTKILRYESVGKVSTQVSYLEMRERPAGLKASPMPANVQILGVTRPRVEFYRFLYDQVGGPWTWTARKLMTDETLSQLIHSSNTRIFVLYFSGDPAGYVEFISDKSKGDVEILSFGLIPQYFGQGLGKFFLNWAIDYAWDQLAPSRLWLHTCDLDHPTAVPTYLKAGFVKKYEKTEQVDLIKPVLVS
jgi:RimJ/RimL family protein N-acetyltransferase